MAQRKFDFASSLPRCGSAQEIGHAYFRQGYTQYGRVAEASTGVDTSGMFDAHFVGWRARPKPNSTPMRTVRARRADSVDATPRAIAVIIGPRLARHYCFDAAER